MNEAEWDARKIIILYLYMILVFVPDSMAYLQLSRGVF